MNLITPPTKAPALIASGSLIALLLLMTLTTPTAHVVVAAFFFLLLLIFLISLTVCFTKSGKRGYRKYDFKIVIVNLFIVIALMFRSSQSLSLLDLLILILTIGGVIFYTDRRIS